MRLAELTTNEVREILAAPPHAVLLPVGSVEPHGPHLPLDVDLRIGEVACERAVALLETAGVRAVIASPIPYGVTEFSRRFEGAVGVTPDQLIAYLGGVLRSLLADGWSHVCVVNNHFEPDQESACRAAVGSLPAGRVSLASPLERRFARTLSDEFKSGACHAGRYETSLMLAAGAPVRPVFSTLESLEVSLSAEIGAGRDDFVEMGMTEAYTGAPAEATAEEGRELNERLAEMIATLVREGIGR
jgi:creatinine amidohydrolase